VCTYRPSPEHWHDALEICPVRFLTPHGLPERFWQDLILQGLVKVRHDLIEIPFFYRRNEAEDGEDIR
jgi:hypothetical protein